MTGDLDDLRSRLRSYLPPWFGDINPILDGLLNGFAYALSLAYGLFAYVRLQTRIMTATDGFLDMIAYDFFGSGLRRNVNEGDDAFRRRILANLFRERGTRKGMDQTLFTLTGRHPSIFEPARPADTGAWGGPAGWGVAGGWGNLTLKAQCFVTAFRPQGSGIPLVAGWGSPAGGWGTPSYAAWENISKVQGAVLDSDIAAAADAAKVAGTNINLQISS